MASQLAETAKAVKMTLFGAVVFFFAYIIFTQSLSIALKVIVARRPLKVTPPTAGFGKLPELPLKSLTLEGSTPNYNLETTSGSLPTMPDRLKVYKLIEPKPSFLSLERAKSLARRLGFQTAAKEISPSLYFWQEGDRSLRANTVTNNFEINMDLFQLTLSVGDLPTPGEIKGMAKGYLDSRGLFNSGFELGSQQVTLVKKEGNSLLKALSLSETSLARIDFFRAVKDGDQTYPILPPDPTKGLIELYYSAVRDNSFPKIIYNVWDFDFNKGETYPLRSLESVWQEVKNNNGFIAHLQHQGSNSLEPLSALAVVDIFIRKIYLAYLDSPEIQNFLQPIYVFEGDGKSVDSQPVNISIYYPALDPAWVE